MATLLFLGASVSQLPAIRYARDAGHRVIAVDGDPHAVAFPFCHVAENVDFADVDRVTELASRLGVEGVLAISTDRAVPPAAAIAARLGLPGIAPHVAAAMTDKALMRERLEEAGVPQPRSTVLTEGTNLEDACAKVSFPAVLKPVDSGGQRGIFRAESVADVRRLLPAALSFSRSHRAMLEEYVEGTELNGILVARNGEPTLVTLSDRLRPRGIGFGVGWIHSFPSSLPAETLAEAERVAVASVRAQGLENGIAFPQLIADEHGDVRVVEIAARIPAGQMADLVWFGTGIRLFKVAIEQALGHTIPDGLVTPAFHKPIAIRFLTASPGVLPLGTVSEIEGLDEVRSAPGVLAAGLYFEPGTTIGPLQVDADRRGYVIATSDTPQHALALADAASRALVVRTADADRTFAHGVRGLFSRRFVPLLAVVAVLAAAASAFVLSDHAKQQALLLGTRVNRTFSPVCRCSTDVAHVSFRLADATKITVEMLNSVGHPVATFLRDRRESAGLKQFVWNGLASTGRALPNGSYVPEVIFPVLHRTLRLSSPIRLDTQPPRVLRFAVRAAGRQLLVRYGFDGLARAELLVDGRRAASTRVAAAAGVISWSARRLALGRHRIAIVGIDAAGNRSRPRGEILRI